MGRVSHGVPVGLRGLATTEVAQGPSGIAEHAQLAAITQEGEEGLQRTARQNVVAARGAVTSNVSEGPHSLLSNIGLVATQQLNEDRNCTGLDNDLGLLSGTRRDVGKSPSSLELHKGMGRSEELDEAADDASLDNLLDWRVALFGEQLSEFGSGLDLEIDLLGEDALNHLGEVLVQLLEREMSART